MAIIYGPNGEAITPRALATHLPAVKPFNQQGEHIDELGDDYEVVQPFKWMDTPVLEMAMAEAKHALREHKLSTVKIEMQIQEYHSRDMLLVIVAAWAKAPGKATWQWNYVPVRFPIVGQLKANLVLSGRWKTSTRH